MLTMLSIKDFVLIHNLTLELRHGLTVLTGETGAGKSILLDAIGLALGLRASQGLVRQGASQASISITFQLPKRHPVYHELRELDLPVAEDQLILRRTFQEGGRSRVYVNDVPTSVNALKRLGPVLVEIQGQFDSHGLLDTTSHRKILVAFCRCEIENTRMQADWRSWRQAKAALAQAEEDIQHGRQQEDYLRYCVNELENLNPSPGEETELSNRRQILMNIESLRGAASESLELLGNTDTGAETQVMRTLGLLDRLSNKIGDGLDNVLESLNAASANLSVAIESLNALNIEGDESELAKTDERLFTLRSVARKHGGNVDDLPQILERQQKALENLSDQSGHLDKLRLEIIDRENDWRKSANILAEKLSAGAEKLDEIVNAELPKLKLENAHFITQLSDLPENEWGENGRQNIQFTATTNPGIKPGPISKISSGGELSRFLLALKVALASDNTLPTLIFDEVDTGVGGATASAVGKRLQQLAENVQVLTITHSPQVAAKGRQHLRVTKSVKTGLPTTHIDLLSPMERQEEIARMLAGSSITPHTMAAAQDLLEG